MDIVEKEVVKGGLTWVEYSVGRTNGRLDIWVKAVPDVEKMFKNEQVDAVEAYGKEWFGFDKKGLHIYRLSSDPAPNSTYTLVRPGTSMIFQDANALAKGTKFNLSFLRIAGISSPDGVRFGVNGACSKQYVKDIANSILAETNKFLYDHIVPVQINLRITSQEV